MAATTAKARNDASGRGSHAPILDALRKYLQSQEVPFQDAPELSALRLGFTGENGNWVCLAVADDKRKLARFYSIAPFTIPPARRAAVNEYLARVGFNMPVGGFELDLDDGEVRLKTSLPLGKAKPTQELLAGLVWPNVAAMDRYLAGLVAVAQHGMDPQQAARV